jgi:hypothetical protein
MKTLQMLTTDDTDFTDGTSVPAPKRLTNCCEVLDCGGKSDATPLWHRATLLEISDASARAKAPSRPTCRRTPKRWRAFLRPLLLRALLLGAVLLAGGAGAATLTVTNLADHGPGSLVLTQTQRPT